MRKSLHRVIASLVAGLACATVVHAAADATDDSYETDQGQALNVPAPGVLVNDTGSSTLTATLVSNPGNGTLTFNSDGSFTYTPNGAFYGSDSFMYEANDGDAADSAIVSLTVTRLEGPYGGGGGGGGGGGYGSGGAPSPVLLALLALAALYPRGLKPSKRRAISP